MCMRTDTYGIRTHTHHQAGELRMDERKFPSGLATIWPENHEQEPITAYVIPPKQKRYNAKWLLLWQDDTGISIMEQAMMEKPLTQTEYRVRDWIIGTIGIGNYVLVNHSECSRALRVARPNVSSAIKRLLELRILLPGPRSGRSKSYMVNPAFCFSGGLQNGIKARAEAKQQGKIIPFQKP